jgi:hypothetical protein
VSRVVTRDGGASWLVLLELVPVELINIIRHCLRVSCKFSLICTYIFVHYLSYVKAAVSNSSWVYEIFYSLNHSDCTMPLGPIQPPAQMSTTYLFGKEGRGGGKAAGVSG